MKVPFIDLSVQHAILREEILAALAKTYDANRFCLGEDVERFESDFAALCGAEGAVGVNNGTSSLHLAARILGVGPGDEVVLPPFTFIATAWCAAYTGARIVFADIERDTFNLSPDRAREACTPQTRAIVVVHLFGQPANMGAMMDLAGERNLAVIEDCAQAHLARYDDAPVGLIGNAGCFSFYPTKNLGGCGEGGAIISRDREVLEKARILRSHGQEKRYEHASVGFNYRMEGFQAAALRVKQRHLPAWTARRRQIASRYHEELKLADLRLPVRPAYGESVYHQFTVRHPRRDDLRDDLGKNGIGTDIIYPVPLHLQPCFRSLGYGPGDFPEAEHAAGTCLSLPIFPELTDEQVDWVIRCVNSF